MLEIRFAWFSMSVNMVICVGLIVTTCVAITFLKRVFASTFRRETQAITTILYTFSACYILRTAYEAYENVRNMQMIREQVYPNQFVVSMETMLIFLAFVDSPICLIFALHHMNQTTVRRLAPIAVNDRGGVEEEEHSEPVIDFS